MWRTFTEVVCGASLGYLLYILFVSYEAAPVYSPGAVFCCTPIGNGSSDCQPCNPPNPLRLP